jgi:hypothetical protein
MANSFLLNGDAAETKKTYANYDDIDHNYENKNSPLLWIPENYNNSKHEFDYYNNQIINKNNKYISPYRLIYNKIIVSIANHIVKEIYPHINLPDINDESAVPNARAVIIAAEAENTPIYTSNYDARIRAPPGIIQLIPRPFYPDPLEDIIDGFEADIKNNGDDSIKIIEKFRSIISTHSNGIRLPESIDSVLATILANVIALEDKNTKNEERDIKNDMSVPSYQLDNRIHFSSDPKKNVVFFNKESQVITCDRFEKMKKYDDNETSEYFISRSFQGNEINKNLWKLEANTNIESYSFVDSCGSPMYEDVSSDEIIYKALPIDNSYKNNTDADIASINASIDAGGTPLEQCINDYIGSYVGEYKIDDDFIDKKIYEIKKNDGVVSNNYCYLENNNDDEGKSLFCNQILSSFTNYSKEKMIDFIDNDFNFLFTKNEFCVLSYFCSDKLFDELNNIIKRIKDRITIFIANMCNMKKQILDIYAPNNKKGNHCYWNKIYDENDMLILKYDIYSKKYIKAMEQITTKYFKNKEGITNFDSLVTYIDNYFNGQINNKGEIFSFEKLTVSVQIMNLVNINVIINNKINNTSDTMPIPIQNVMTNGTIYTENTSSAAGERFLSELINQPIYKDFMNMTKIDKSEIDNEAYKLFNKFKTIDQAKNFFSGPFENTTTIPVSTVTSTDSDGGRGRGRGRDAGRGRGRGAGRGTIHGGSNDTNKKVDYNYTNRAVNATNPKHFASLLMFGDEFKKNINILVNELHETINKVSEDIKSNSPVYFEDIEVNEDVMKKLTLNSEYIEKKITYNSAIKYYGDEQDTEQSDVTFIKKYITHICTILEKYKIIDNTEYEAKQDINTKSFLDETNKNSINYNIYDILDYVNKNNNDDEINKNKIKILNTMKIYLNIFYEKQDKEHKNYENKEKIIQENIKAKVPFANTQKFIEIPDITRALSEINEIYDTYFGKISDGDEIIPDIIPANITDNNEQNQINININKVVNIQNPIIYDALPQKNDGSNEDHLVGDTLSLYMGYTTDSDDQLLKLEINNKINALNFNKISYSEIALDNVIKGNENYNFLVGKNNSRYYKRLESYFMMKDIIISNQDIIKDFRVLIESIVNFDRNIINFNYFGALNVYNKIIKNIEKIKDLKTLISDEVDTSQLTEIMNQIQSINNIYYKNGKSAIINKNNCCTGTPNFIPKFYESYLIKMQKKQEEFKYFNTQEHIKQIDVMYTKYTAILKDIDSLHNNFNKYISCNILKHKHLENNTPMTYFYDNLFNPNWEQTLSKYKTLDKFIDKYGANTINDQVKIYPILYDFNEIHFFNKDISPGDRGIRKYTRGLLNKDNYVDDDDDSDDIINLIISKYNKNIYYPKNKTDKQFATAYLPLYENEENGDDLTLMMYDYFQQIISINLFKIYNKIKNSAGENNVNIEDVFKITNTKAFKSKDESERYENAIKNIDIDYKLNYIYDAVFAYTELYLYNKILHESNKVSGIFDQIINKLRDKTQSIVKTVDTIEDTKIEYKTLEDNLKKYEFPSFDKFIRQIDSINTFSSRENKIMVDNDVQVLQGMCLNTNKSNLLSTLPLDFRKIDMNGNTILNKLIDQFNIDAITNVLSKMNILVTYKNGNNVLPYKYCINKLITQNSNYQVKKIKNIYDCDNLLIDKFKKYSEIIKNSLESNKEYEDIIFIGAPEFTITVFMNSILLLSEYLWECVEESIGNDCGLELWENDDIGSLKNILFPDFDDKLLSDIDISKNETTNNNITSVVLSDDDALKIDIRQKINDFENKIVNIDKLSSKNEDNPKIKNKLVIKKLQYTNARNALKNRLINLNKIGYDKEPDSENIGDNKDDYYGVETAFVSDGPDYYKKIKEINNVIFKPENNHSHPCEFIFRLLDNKTIENASTELEEYNILSKFYNCVYKQIYSNYMDLDKYEGITYNRLSTRIIEILKANAVNPLKYELYYALMDKIINSSELKIDAQIYLNSESIEAKQIISMINKIFENTMLKENMLSSDDTNTEDTDINVLINKLKEIGSINDKNDSAISKSKDTAGKNSETLDKSLKKYIDFYKSILSSISKSLLTEMNNIIELLKINSMIISMGRKINDTYIEVIKGTTSTT